MSKSKFGHSTLSGLIDSDDDDLQFNTPSGMPTPDSAAENKAPVKKGRKAIASKVAQAKAPPRRTSGRLSAKANDVEPAKKHGKKQVATLGKRKVLADKTNQQNISDTEEVDEFDQNEDVVMDDPAESIVVAVKTTKSKPTAKKTATRGRPSKAATIADDASSSVPQKEAHVTKRKGRAKREIAPEPTPEKVIQETQVPAQDEMEVDDGGDEEVIEETVSRVASNVRRPRSDSMARQAVPIHRRAGSGSDTERSDPALRRKLGDMTNKFEALNIKYQDLREIGLKEAERNFERLKKQSEEKSIAAEKLIASLKSDLTSQAALAKESRSLKKKVEFQATEIGALKAQVTQLTTSLSEIRAEAQAENKKSQVEIKKLQAENKTLSTKLAANRTASASVESASNKVSGSAVKANGGIRMVGSVEAAQVAQAAQLKEDLYSDLTGLIIRGVKRDSEDDVFDCIQTGRNGTLHFKLAVTNEKSAESYEDAQYQYVPQLDPSRDKALMDLLPDYLVEEITFPRPQAARFYDRVGKALTEKVEVD
ncbi:chromosome segregation protein Csm1/Pcs1-domain-containing protein [Bisporella sp. PMI_857]|nr:chromosome segregation protein Csm1/Pcs1-domain-containing protein [Bisporella sp. PMI_857]